MYLQTSGQKHLRTRLHNKQLKQKETLSGLKRHENAINEMNNRRQTYRQTHATGQTYAQTQTQTTKIIINKNKYLNDFNLLKNSFQKKKGLFICLFVCLFD